jgi:hypothetical protein
MTGDKTAPESPEELNKELKSLLHQPYDNYLNLESEWERRSDADHFKRHLDYLNRKQNPSENHNATCTLRTPVTLWQRGPMGCAVSSCRYDWLSLSCGSDCM